MDGINQKCNKTIINIPIQKERNHKSLKQEDSFPLFRAHCTIKTTENLANL